MLTVPRAAVDVAVVVAVAVVRGGRPRRFVCDGRFDVSSVEGFDKLEVLVVVVVVVVIGDGLVAFRDVDATDVVVVAVVIVVDVVCALRDDDRSDFICNKGSFANLEFAIFKHNDALVLKKGNYWKKTYILRLHH